MQKIIIDDKIPFIKGIFDHLADVKYLNGSDISAEDVRDADAMIIRTRTRCDEKLLGGSTVKFIATATIGFDHIDTDFCEKRGISWTNAPGCNAASVQQYIAAALLFLQKNSKINLSASTIGIVGVGNVGKLVAEFCENIGMRVLLNDPPRQLAEQGIAGGALSLSKCQAHNDEFVSLNDIAEQCDIITFHTPLNAETFHLADKNFFEKVKRKPCIINSARGEIVDTKSIKTAKKQQQISGIVLDCWENEPNIDLELLAMCDLATAHIAGYSADGKANATTACVRFVSQKLGLGLDEWSVSEIPHPTQPLITETSLQDAVLHTYNIEEDFLKLKNNPEKFEYFRNYYPLRREFGAYFIDTPDALLEKIGFKINSF
ncbi:erythronate-4-phosphate dehydrogenase [Bacteroidia bacterium]|nr:erythronate-4-phosphate dehydrogenase [Bacteroidia bacterium]